MKFTIPGRLDGLNEYTSSNRTNRYKANNDKKINQMHVKYAIRKANLSKVDKYPVKLKIAWYEPNKKRDIDNVVFATKFIQDALVNEGILVNDSQYEVLKALNDIHKENNISLTKVQYEILKCLPQCSSILVKNNKMNIHKDNLEYFLSKIGVQVIESDCDEKSIKIKDILENCEVVE